MAAPESFERITLAGRAEASGSQWRPGARPLLLSRALYRTRVIDLSGVRARERHEAIALQLAAWAPFDAPGYAVGLAGTRALAFAWDAARIEGLLSVPGGTVAQTPKRTIWPEGLLRPPLQEGLRLHVCLDGVEAQAWHGGLPLESQWWPSLPDEAQWRAFLHGRVASTHGDAPPRDAGTPWRSRPWLRAVPPEALDRQGSGWERLLWGGLATVLAVAAGMRGHEHQQAHAAHEAAVAERAQGRNEAAPLAAQREQVLRDQARLDRLSVATGGVPVIEMLGSLSQGLPAKGLLLRDLKLEGSLIRLALGMSPELPRSEVVQSLQAGGRFSGVRELREPGPGGSVVFEMSYVRQAAPGASSAEATGPVKGAKP